MQVGGRFVEVGPEKLGPWMDNWIDNLCDTGLIRKDDRNNGGQEDSDPSV